MMLFGFGFGFGFSFSFKYQKNVIIIIIGNCCNIIQTPVVRLPNRAVNL